PRDRADLEGADVAPIAARRSRQRGLLEGPLAAALVGLALSGITLIDGGAYLLRIDGVGRASVVADRGEQGVERIRLRADLVVAPCATEPAPARSVPDEVEARGIKGAVDVVRSKARPDVLRDDGTLDPRARGLQRPDAANGVAQSGGVVG